jgi:hypothetical protein
MTEQPWSAVAEAAERILSELTRDTSLDRQAAQQIRVNLVSQAKL